MIGILIAAVCVVGLGKCGMELYRLYQYDVDEYYKRKSDFIRRHRRDHPELFRTEE